MRAWSRKSPETRRREILDAASELFQRFGPVSVSMKEIAESARVSRATVYQHFPSREVLLRELVAVSLEEPRAAAQHAANRDASLEERLFGVIDAYLGTLYTSGYGSPRHEDMVVSARRFASDLIDREAAHYQRLIAGLLREANDAGDIDLEREGLSPIEGAETLYGAAQGIARPRSQLIAPGRFRRRVRFLVAAFVDRLRPKVV